MAKKSQIIPTAQVLPTKLFILPLQGKPIFPGIFTPMMIPAQREVEVVEQAMAGDGFLGLVLTQAEEIENVTDQDLYSIGTAVKIVSRIAD